MKRTHDEYYLNEDLEKVKDSFVKVAEVIGGMGVPSCNSM